MVYVTLVVLHFGQRDHGGLNLHGYIQGDLSVRPVVCCVNAIDGAELVKQFDKNPNQPLLIEIDRRWLIPVLQQEAA